MRWARTTLPTVLLVGCLGCAGDQDPHDAAGSPTEVESPSSAASSRTSRPTPEPTAEPTAQPTAQPTTESTVAPTTEPTAGPSAEPPPPAADAAELARRLVAAENEVRAPGVQGERVRRAAFETQLLYRQLTRRTEWRRTVLDILPERYRNTATAHISAQESLRSMHTRLSNELPAWVIADPAPRETLLGAYREAERRFGVDWEVLAAINLVETRMGRIRSTSSAGAQGPMQFIPATWAAYGEGDISDPRDAIMAAGRHLAAHGAADGRLDDALYAYNNHRAYVAGIRSYAAVLAADPAAFRGLYHWQVLFLSEIGDMWLPVGYRRRTPIPAATYAARHPERHLSTETH